MDGKHRYRHLLLEMTVNFLRMSLKHASVCSDTTLREIDAFVPLLISCLHGRRGKVASLSLKALTHMIALPLPSLKDNAAEAGSAVIRLLDAVPNMNDPVAQDCLRLLARILHAKDWFQPTSLQVKSHSFNAWQLSECLQVNSLLTLISVDLDVRTDPHASFRLLRSILDQKIVVPKVYDLMKQVRTIHHGKTSSVWIGVFADSGDDDSISIWSDSANGVQSVSAVSHELSPFGSASGAAHRIHTRKPGIRIRNRLSGSTDQ